MSVKYDLNKEGQFIIEDYDKAKTFASFLPGVAGIDGIPMWSFYCNRGQGMGSFGVKDKDSTIMEFMPAVTMYKNIELQGFRTFIKYNGSIHEIFSSISNDSVKRRMIIEKNLFKVEEVNDTLKIAVTVTYFAMPRETFAAIVRKVEVKNLEATEKEIEILDGLTQIIPFGYSNAAFQAIANLARAWFDVINLENNIPYYKVRATTSDSSEVGEVNKGHFYLSFTSESKGLLSPIFDMDVIFGNNTTLTKPEGWDCSIDELVSRKQVPENKIPGGFTGTNAVLKDKFVICTVIGHIATEELINRRKNDFTLEYIERKQKEAVELLEELVSDVSTKTAHNNFDKYVEQSYLDNTLRGGRPLIFNIGDKNHVYHVYSRKHGDTEREYNFFSLEPAVYSQGNGNFRDVNQNRRNDVLIYPEVKDFNVKQFMSLIQADGYNPLSVKGSTFKLNENALESILELVVNDKNGIEKILKSNYTPGKLISYIVDNDVKLTVEKEEMLKKALEASEQNYEAEFGEGYWSDHWTYNMDLVDTYLLVYPDTLENFVFEDNSYRFFDSPVRVLKREEKHVLTKGKVRQYGSILEDEEKCHHLGISVKGTNWLKTKNGLGNIYETNLFAKLISLALNKFVTMDPYGMGIEMEGEKPGWNDAMNGLPGLFGSAMNETAELKRIVEFVIEVSSKFDKEFKLPVEMVELLDKAEEVLSEYTSGNVNDFAYWDKIASAREEYRDKVYYGINGEEKTLSTKRVLEAFKKFNNKIEQGLSKALKYGNGVYPTYFTYTATKYEVLEGKTNPVNGYQNVKVLEFECNPLPLFLEAPARILKSMKNKEAASALYKEVKESNMYDRKLGMYKTSEPIDAFGNEIGRVRAFTAGWLEREAVFLHMEYKYLLAILKSGLYKEYYEDIKTALISFLDPAVYGRSILENSSFIASSVNPDESLHGRGFQARLSGSTSEVLSMWFIMMAGKKVFTYEKDELKLTLSPILSGDFFDEEGKAGFKFLGKTDVIYYNPKKADTYGDNGVKIERMILTTQQGENIELQGDTIGKPYAEAVRNGEVRAIKAYLA
jgi:hypothetical protein